MKRLVLGLLILGICLIAGNAFAVIGIDANTVLMLHFNGTDGSTNFVDSSFSGHSVTAVNDAQLDTASNKFGGASGLFDGTEDYLTIPDSDDWNFASGDFTIDYWVKFNSLDQNQTFVSQREVGDYNNYWSISWLDGDHQINFAFVDDASIKANYMSNWMPTLNTWYHLAIVRTTTTAKVFLDGVSQSISESTAFGTNDVGNIADVLNIGRRNDGLYFNGWIDEFRVSKGAARWTSDFSPPTSEYEVIPEPATMLLFGIGGVVTALLKRKKKLS